MWMQQLTMPNPTKLNPDMNGATKVGFVTSPLIPGIVIATDERIRGVVDIFPIGGLLVIGYFFAGLATFTLGRPVILLLPRFNLIKLWTTVISGLAIGAIVGILFQLPDLILNRVVLVYSMAGAAAAFWWWIFWLIGKKTPRDVQTYPID